MANKKNYYILLYFIFYPFINIIHVNKLYITHLNYIILKNCDISINKYIYIYYLESNEGLRYERYILLLYFPFINHVLEFIFSKEWLLKWYSITKFNFLFQINLHFKRKRDVFVYIIKRSLRLNFNLVICTKF